MKEAILNVISNALWRVVFSVDWMFSNIGPISTGIVIGVALTTIVSKLMA